LWTSGETTAGRLLNTGRYESESDWLSWADRFIWHAKGQQLVAFTESVSDTTWMRGLGLSVYTPLIPG